MVRICVPVNFSEYSVNAVMYAIALGRKVAAEITLVHCSYPLSDESSDLKSDDEINQEFKNLEQKLRENLPEGNQVQFKTKILVGYPEDVLVELSKNEEPDAIVMGTSSKGETIKELLGSVTSDVLKNAKVPVLAIPKTSSVNVDKRSDILFVTDFTDKDYRSLHKLIRLITPFETLIHVVHFATSAPDQWDKKRLEAMSLYCRETYRRYTMNFEFITGDEFISSLDDYIEANEIDMIAMTRRKRNMISQIFHPSITRKILFHTDVPLLVFHE